MYEREMKWKKIMLSNTNSLHKNDTLKTKFHETSDTKKNPARRFFPSLFYGCGLFSARNSAHLVIWLGYIENRQSQIEMETTEKKSAQFLNLYHCNCSVEEKRIAFFCSVLWACLRHHRFGWNVAANFWWWFSAKWRKRRVDLLWCTWQIYGTIKLNSNWWARAKFCAKIKQKPWISMRAILCKWTVYHSWCGTFKRLNAIATIKTWDK